MSHRELALRFLDCFCAADTETLGTLLAPDLKFRGPMVKVNTASAYLGALHGSLDPARYELHEMTEDDDGIVAHYDYLKPDEVVPVTQRFRFADGVISEIHVSFTSADVKPPR